MTTAKVIELLSEGDTLEAAVNAAVAEAAKSVRGIRSVYLDGIQAIIEDDKVVRYRVNAKVTFILE